MCDYIYKWRWIGYYHWAKAGQILWIPPTKMFNILNDIYPLHKCPPIEELAPIKVLAESLYANATEESCFAEARLYKPTVDLESWDEIVLLIIIIDPFSGDETETIAY